MDITGAGEKPTMSTISLYKSRKYSPFVGSAGQVGYRPEPDSLELVRTIQVEKRNGKLTLPKTNFTTHDYEPDENGDPTVIFMYVEHWSDGSLHHLGTMHFEKTSSDPISYELLMYNEVGPDDSNVLVN